MSDKWVAWMHKNDHCLNGLTYTRSEIYRGLDATNYVRTPWLDKPSDAMKGRQQVIDNLDDDDTETLRADEPEQPDPPPLTFREHAVLQALAGSSMSEYGTKGIAKRAIAIAETVEQMVRERWGD